MADTLCIYDNVVFLSCLTACDDIVDQLLLIVIIFLRNQDILCTIGNTPLSSEK